MNVSVALPQQVASCHHHLIKQGDHDLEFEKQISWKVTGGPDVEYDQYVTLCCW